MRLTLRTPKTSEYGLLAPSSTSLRLGRSWNAYDWWSMTTLSSDASSRKDSSSGCGLIQKLNEPQTHASVSRLIIHSENIIVHKVEAMTDYASHHFTVRLNQ